VCKIETEKNGNVIRYKWNLSRALDDFAANVFTEKGQVLFVLNGSRLLRTRRDFEQPLTVVLDSLSAANGIDRINVLAQQFHVGISDAKNVM